MIRALLGGAEGGAEAGETLSYREYVFKMRTGGSAPRGRCWRLSPLGPFLVLKFWKRGSGYVQVFVLFHVCPQDRAGPLLTDRPGPAPAQSLQVAAPCPQGRRPALMPLALPVVVYLGSTWAGPAPALAAVQRLQAAPSAAPSAATSAAPSAPPTAHASSSVTSSSLLVSRPAPGVELRTWSRCLPKTAFILL